MAYDTTASDVRARVPDRIRQLMQNNPFSEIVGQSTSPYVSPPSPPEPPVDNEGQVDEAIQLDPKEAIRSDRRGVMSRPLPPSLRPQSLERATDDAFPEINDGRINEGIDPPAPSLTRPPATRPLPPSLRPPGLAQVLDEAMPVKIPDSRSSGRGDGDLVLPGPKAPQADPAQASVDRAKGVAAAIAASRQARAQQDSINAQKRDADMARRSQLGQNAKAAADRRRETGLNADPDQVQGNADEAVLDFVTEQDNPFDAQKDLNDRLERSRVAKDTATYKAELAAYQQRFEEWKAEYNNALATDDTGESARKLLPSMPKPPAPPPSITGGRTPQELEESVGATMARLPIEQQGALRSHLVARHLPPGVSEDDLTPEQLKQYEDKALRESEIMYADLPFEERLQVMAADAQRVARTPDLNIPAGVRGGFGAGSGDNARNEDLPPEELALLGKDFRDGFPSVNVQGNRGGTFVRNPNGSLSARAPNPDHAGRFLNLEARPERITPEWTNSMKEAGIALGLDPTKFDNEGAFVAASAKRLDDYQKKVATGRWATQALPTGGFRLVPTDKLRQEALPRQLSVRANKFLQGHHGRVATAEERAELREAAAAGNEQKVREIMAGLTDASRDANQQMAHDMRRREVEVKNLNNPARRQGIINESVRNAATQEEEARLWRLAGRPDIGEGIDDNIARGKAFEAEKKRADAEIEAMKNRGGKEERLPGEVNTAGINYAVDQALGEDGMLPSHHVATYLLARNEELRARKRPELNEQKGAEELAAAMVARNPEAAFRSGVMGLALQSVASDVSANVTAGMQDLMGLDLPGSGQGGRATRRAEFIRLAKERITKNAVSDEQLGRWYDENVK